MLCGTKCKVYQSPYKEEYHRLRLEQKVPLSKLVEIAREKGENISKMSFSRHFQYHVSPLESSTVIEKWVEQKRKERFEIINEIENNLRMLKQKTEEAMQLPINAANLTAFTKLMTEIRLSLEWIARHKEMYLGKEPVRDEAMIMKIIDAFNGIPSEYRDQVLKKLRTEG